MAEARKNTRKRKKKKKTVVRFHPPKYLNIGFLIFAAIFLYVAVYGIMYFSRDRVSIYEVVYGKNADQSNKTYNALLIRTENQVLADASGYLNYYVRSGARARVGTTIFTIDESGKIQDYLASNESGTILTEEDYELLRQDISAFTADYSDLKFSETYNFKIDLASALMECTNMNVINEKLAELDADGGYTYSSNRAATAGIVEYYSDGFEGKLISDITAADFDTKNYSRKNISSGDLIAAGDQAYKIIGNERWYVLLSMSEEELSAFGNDSEMTVKFLDDGTTTTGKFQIVRQGDCNMGVVTLDQYMVKYADKRYAQVQIIKDQTEGLKIPKTSIVNKEFFTIPKEFASAGGDSKEIGFFRQYYDEEKKELSIEFLTPEIYYFDESSYYVDNEEFEKGDVLLKQDSTENYTIGQTKPLEGVYNVNNGYCIFRRIERVAGSGAYQLVKANTSYGLKVYDHIVIDGSMVHENDVVFR